ncbi:MAG: mandelate racemase/muconate lactonizing enzyme family protein [Clostridiales bacterium]|nr:mandelate racemase/muconate lactonizing enzyme family protein [Clostridiales bacterium]
MKITSVDVIECRPNVMGSVIYVRINTDVGISGFGEVGLSYGKAHYAGVGIARDFRALIIGKDPMKAEAIWEMIFRSTFWGMGGGTVINAGMSAIDTALWDIKGKAYGVPVYELLGGKTNEKIRAYASQLQFGWGPEHLFLTDPKDYAKATRDALDEGYTAIKVDPMGVTDEGKWARESGGPNWKMRGKLNNRMLDTVYARTEAMRREGGDDLDIIIETHSYPDLHTGIQLGRCLKPLNIYYYEEPCNPLNVENMLEIHKALPYIALASGERIYTRWGFREFLEKHVLQVIQPDLTLCGGISETKKICDMANIYDAAVQIHVCGGPISTAAALQVEAVIPNFLIHEVHVGAIKTEMRKLCKHDYQPVNGEFDVPDLPGIGQELTDEAIEEALHVYVIQ